MTIRNLLLMAAGLCIATLSYASEMGKPQLFKFPSETVLKEQLAKEGLDSFNEKTNVAKRLAGKELNANGIAIVVNLAVYDYLKVNKDPLERAMIQSQIDGVLKAVLAISQKST